MFSNSLQYQTTLTLTHTSLFLPSQYDAARLALGILVVRRRLGACSLLSFSPCLYLAYTLGLLRAPPGASGSPRAPAINASHRAHSQKNTTPRPKAHSQLNKPPC